MFSVGWDVHEVAGLHLDRRLVILESQPGRPLQNDDPFVLMLVVPEGFARRMTVRDDAFYAHVGTFKQDRDQLAW